MGTNSGKRIVKSAGQERIAPQLMVVYTCPRCADGDEYTLDAYDGPPSCLGVLGSGHMPTFCEPIRLSEKTLEEMMTESGFVQAHLFDQDGIDIDAWVNVL